MQLRVHISKEKDSKTFVSLPRNLVTSLLGTREGSLEPIVLPLKLTRSEWFEKGITTSGLTKKNKKTFYVCWTGTASSLPRTLEIGSQLAAALELYEEEFVEVEPVSSKDCLPAVEIRLQTQSEQDWSLVALHREYLEQVLLNQVRIVAVGQSIPLRLSGSTIVFLRVTSALPKSPCLLLKRDSLLFVDPPFSKESNELVNGTGDSVHNKSENNLKVHSHMLRIIFSFERHDNHTFRMSQNTAASLGMDEGDCIVIYQADSYLGGILQFDDNMPSNHISVHYLQGRVSGFINLSRVFVTFLNKTSDVQKGITIYTVEEKNYESAEECRNLLENVLQMTEKNEMIISQRHMLWLADKEEHQNLLLCIDDYRLPEVVNIAEYDEPWSPNAKEKASKEANNEKDTKYRTNLKAISIQHVNLPKNWKDLVLQTIEDFTSYPSESICKGEGPQRALTSIYNALEPVFLYEEQNMLLDSSFFSMPSSYRLKPSCCHFFYCSQGFGSTFLLSVLTKRLLFRKLYPVQVLFLRLSIHADEPVNRTVLRFRQVFSQAYLCRPSLIILEDSSELFCNHASDSSPEEQDIENNLLEKMIFEYIQACYYTGGIAILFVSKQRLSNFPQRLQRPGLFSEIISLESLTTEDKLILLQDFIDNLQVEENIWEQLKTVLDGCSVKDLKRLAHRVMLFADEDFKISKQELKKALDGFQPISFMGQLVNTSNEVEVEDFDHIGGLHEAKTLLRDILELPLKYSDLFTSAPLRLASGALLYGPPGCGKTLLVHVATKQFNLRLVSVKGPELLNKYIGASEAAVRDCFRRAASLAPCILFFDEFESLAPQRGNDSTGVSDRVVNSLLAELDGVEPLQKGVFVIAATSRPDRVDAALLRPGRLDKWIPFDLPTVDERKEILSILLSRLCLNDLPVDLDYFAKATDGYSGADLRALVYDAHLRLVKRRLLEEHMEASLTQDDLEAALQETGPSLNAHERMKYERIAQKLSRSKASLDGGHPSRVALI
eukprot:jgi/Galph1/2180/GphlegSOOS_G846.1